MMRTLLIMALLALAAPAAAAKPASPDQTVDATLRTLAAMIADCRIPLAADPVAVRGIVDQYLRPNAEVMYAAQLILGRHWTDADAHQRRRFAEGLYGTLSNRYATGLLLLTPNNVVVVPATEPPGEDLAQVELRIQAGLMTPVPVFLQMRRGGDRWRIYDARWEGQSYVLSLRNAFSQQIRRDGLERVIQRLEATAGTPAGIPEDRDTAAGRCLRARSGR
jgi:phospholipid transport system substrate-binding protein